MKSSIEARLVWECGGWLPLFTALAFASVRCGQVIRGPWLCVGTITKSRELPRQSKYPYAEIH